MNSESDILRRLFAIGRALVSERDADAVLQRIMAEARELTGARFVALGVLNEQRTELARFLSLGIDGKHQQAIGGLPRGRGVLGVLIEHPEPLRLAHVAAHPQSYGFPAGHPRMDSFLGVPIQVRGEVWGNLYLADKRGAGEFTEEDQLAVTLLADVAATAIDNARAYERSEQRRVALEQAVQGLEAARDIADAIGSEGASGELERTLELVVKRGRALVEARSVLILLREGHELVVVAAAGHVGQAIGRRIPVAASTAGTVLERRIAERISDTKRRLRISPELLGVPAARTALIVPIVHAGEALGVLSAFDRGDSGSAFTDADERLLRTFAASAANAIAVSRSVRADRLRAAVEAADAERARWARELHDQTLQALAGLRVGLSGALRRDDPTVYREVTGQAIEDIDTEIANLRGIIADLRPSALDSLGLAAALAALVDRRREDGLEIDAELELPDWLDETRPAAESLDTAVYRVIQEALTNIVKHAQASRVRVRVKGEDDALLVEVSDDGVGFDPHGVSGGFGLGGMRERVFLLGGTLQIDSGPEGSRVRARLPLPAAGSGSAGTDEAVS